MPPAPFALLTLGYPSLSSSTGEPIRFRTRKHFAVLIRMALAGGHRCSREELMEMLWPSVPAKLARHSLAQALTVIKSKVGRERIVVARSAVSLVAGSVNVDALSIGERGVDVSGTFLEGFDIPGARGFDQWKDEWTSKLLPKIRDSLVHHMSAARRLGDFGTVERHASALLQFDPLSEDGVRGVLEARAWVGDRSGALKTYENYVTQLAEVLSAQPSTEIVRMATLLREGNHARRPPSVSEPHGRRERRMEAETIIGRTREFSLLFDSWIGVKKTVPRVVVVTGDPGIGKTTLTNAFLSSCQLEGAVVARVQAYDAERELPFAVLSELVRQLVLQRTIGGAEPEALAELARVCADVGTAFPGVPRAPDWSSEVIPIRLADALLKTVTAAADDSPLVLVIDDVHASDNSSAAILHMLARKLGRARFMLVLAGRPTELRQSPAGSLVYDNSIHALSVIEVGPLSNNSARELVVRLVGPTEPEGAPVNRILEAGRGNPLALELLTREWVDHGPDSLLRDVEAINTIPARRIGIPPAVQGVFNREVRRLDSSARAVLDFAAVLGRRLHEIELYQTVGVNPIAASTALSRLMDEGFLREVQGGLEFRNELIRAQAYYAVPTSGREHLHRVAGEALAMGSKEDGTELEIAWHFIRGRASDQAVPHALGGAERCLERGAPNEAEQVLTAIASTNLRPTVRQVMLLAQALLDQSKGEQVAPHLDALWQAEGLSGRDRARIAAMRASAEYMLARETGVRHTAAAEEALCVAQDAGDPTLVAKALNVLSRAHGETGNALGLEQVRDLVDRLLVDPDYQSLPMIHYTAGYCAYAGGSAVDAVVHVRRALDLGTENTRPTDTIPLLNGLAVAHHHAGNIREAEESYQRGLDLARRIGDDSWSCTFSTNLCGLLVHEGKTQAAVSCGRQATLLAQRALHQPRSVMAYTNLANAYLLSGDHDNAVRCLEHGKLLLDDASNWEPRVVFLIESACVWLALGDTELALRSISTLEEVGLSLLGPHPGHLERLVAFKTAHLGDARTALHRARAARDRYKGRTALSYISVNAAVAWLERRFEGGLSRETEVGLCLLDTLGLSGTKALLRMESFLP